MHCNGSMSACLKDHHNSLTVVTTQNSKHVVSSFHVYVSSAYEVFAFQTRLQYMFNWYAVSLTLLPELYIDVMPLLFSSLSETNTQLRSSFVSLSDCLIANILIAPSESAVSTRVWPPAPARPGGPASTLRADTAEL